MKHFCYHLIIASTLIFLAPFTHSNDKLDFSIYLIQDLSSQSGSLFSEVDQPDGIRIRKLKASAKYDISDSFSIKISNDYNANRDQFEFEDIYARYKTPIKLELQLGKFKEPFGLANSHSIKTQYLLERPTPSSTFTFGRNEGAMLSYRHSRWSARLAMFNTKSIEKDKNDIGRGEAKIARITAVPFKNKNLLIHLGAGLNERDLKGSFFDINEQLIGREVGNLIHSRNFKAETIDTDNIEFAIGFKQFLLQTEKFTQRILETNTLDHNLSGEYIDLLWTINGKPRKYSKGEFDFKKSKRTIELALRQSSTSLESYLTGDNSDSRAIAVNYYIDNTARFSLEYATAELEQVKKSERTNFSGKSITARFQLSF